MPQQKGIGKRPTTQKYTNRVNHLLVIAINEYQQLPSLYNCVKDGEDLITTFTSQYQFESNNITFLKNGEATLGNITKAIKKYTNLSTNDNLIIVFSGHGEYDQVTDSGFWMPVDAKYGEEHTYFSNEELKRILRGVNCHHLFLIIDSCFSGTLFRNRNTATNFDRREEDASRWALTAGKKELVSDGQPGDNSPFMTALLKYLKRDNKPKSILALINYVIEVVDSNAHQSPRGEVLNVGGHEGGIFVFHPDDNIPQEEPMPSQEEIDWQETRKQNNLVAYQTFLQHYPNSVHSEKAQQTIAQLQQLAKEKEERAFWQKVKTEGTATAYSRYKITYPNGKYIEEALLQIKRLSVPQRPKTAPVKKKKVEQPTSQSDNKLEETPDLDDGAILKKILPIIGVFLLTIWGAYSWMSSGNEEPSRRTGMVSTNHLTPGELAQNNEINNNQIQDSVVVEQQNKQDDVTRDDVPQEYRQKVLNRLDNNMVQVKGGTFTMGCKKGRDRDCDFDEKNTHKVTLDGYAIGKYEVTQEEWYVVMGQNPSNYTDCKQCAVEMVSWDDIQVFIKRLNQFTNKNYRLPTEAEWEFAARGGRKSKGYQYAGGNKLSKIAWYYENSGDKWINEDDWSVPNLQANNGRVHPVGKKQANELGLYDMSGNLWEWCEDSMRKYTRQAVSNPIGEAMDYKVYRGGSWGFGTQYSRISDRSHESADRQSAHIGFRLAQ